MAVGNVGMDVEELMSKVQDQMRRSDAAQRLEKAQKSSSGADASKGSGGGGKSGSGCDPAAQQGARETAAATEGQKRNTALAAPAEPTKAAPSRGLTKDPAQDALASAAVGTDLAKKAATPTAAATPDMPKSSSPATGIDAKKTAAATPAAPTTQPSRILKRGDSGDDVKALQQNLNKHGASLAEDGKFGPKTLAALSAFQRSKGMTPDGSAGPRTNEALKGEPSAPARPRPAAPAISGAQPSTGAARPSGSTPRPIAGPTTPGSGSAIDRNKAAAQALLNNPNVSYMGSLSTGSDRKAIEQIARTGQVTVPHSGQTITPKPQMMEALAKMAEAGPLKINALTGGTHSANSNHYRGTAVDLQVGGPAQARQLAIAAQFGGRRNSESDHIHLDF